MHTGTGANEKVLLEFLQISQENTCARVSFLITLQTEAYNVIKKETLAQMLFCEFHEIVKNTFFTEYRQTTASGQSIIKSGVSFSISL